MIPLSGYSSFAPRGAKWDPIVAIRNLTERSQIVSTSIEVIRAKPPVLRLEPGAAGGGGNTQNR